MLQPSFDNVYKEELRESWHRPIRWPRNGQNSVFSIISSRTRRGARCI